MSIQRRARSLCLVLIFAGGLTGCSRGSSVWVDNRSPADYVLFLALSSETDGYFFAITPSTLGLVYQPHDGRATAYVLLDGSDCQRVASGSIDQQDTGILIDPGDVVTLVPNQQLPREPSEELHMFEWLGASAELCGTERLSPPGG